MAGIARYFSDSLARMGRFVDLLCQYATGSAFSSKHGSARYLLISSVVLELTGGVASWAPMKPNSLHRFAGGDADEPGCVWVEVTSGVASKFAAARSAVLCFCASHVSLHQANLKRGSSVAANWKDVCSS